MTDREEMYDAGTAGMAMRVAETKRSPDRAEAGSRFIKQDGLQMEAELYMLPFNRDDDSRASLLK